MAKGVEKVVETTEVEEAVEETAAVEEAPQEETQEEATGVKEGVDELSPEDLSDLLDEDDVDTKEVAEEKPEEESEEKSEEEKPEEELQEEIQEEEPEPEEEEEPAAQAKPQEQAQTSEDPEKVKKDMEEFFQSTVDLLAENVYGFDEETAEELDTQPSKVLPKLAANLHMQVLTAAVTQIANAFPSMLAMHEESQRAMTQTEDAFFAKYPNLKDHKELVTNTARVYRQLNPNATPAQIEQEVAAMAMVQARIPVPAEKPQKKSATAPAIPTSARGGAPASTAVPQKSEWEELIEEE